MWKASEFRIIRVFTVLWENDRDPEASLRHDEKPPSLASREVSSSLGTPQRSYIYGENEMISSSSQLRKLPTNKNERWGVLRLVGVPYETTKKSDPRRTNYVN